MATWVDIPDIFLVTPADVISESVEYHVQIKFMAGKIIECNGAWLLLVKLPSPAKEIAIRWVTCCGVLLAANNGWRYGVIQRNDTWWLVQRFTTQLSVSALWGRVDEHVAVATLLGQRLQNHLQHVTASDNRSGLSYIAKNGLV